MEKKRVKTGGSEKETVNITKNNGGVLDCIKSIFVVSSNENPLKLT